jgi:hypothetical protein
MNRREFVFTGVTAAGTASCTGWPAQAASAPALPNPPNGPPVFAVIFDQRFAAARTFAQAAAWRGHRVFGYGGDLTAIWLHRIEPHWSRRAGALAGMTTPTALFCLEQLAAQHWLRVVTRTEHRAGPEQSLISWIIA